MKEKLSVAGTSMGSMRPVHEEVMCIGLRTMA